MELSEFGFKKYHSIDKLSSMNLKNMYSYFLNIENIEFVVLEKAHGAHYSFHTDGEQVVVGKRTNIILDTYYFYRGHKKVYNKYFSNVIMLYKSVCDQFEDVKYVQIDGELIGGEYLHDDVKQVQDVSRVQKEVNYCPHLEFYAYDIRFCNHQDI
jgi:hypothetical protein